MQPCIFTLDHPEDKHSLAMSMTYIVDQFISCIWTDKFQAYGDFELVVPWNWEVLNEIQIDKFVRIQESKKFMLIENVEYKFDVDQGPVIVATGRSAESLFINRVLETTYDLSGDFVTKVNWLVDQLLVTPSDDYRRIDLAYPAEPSVPDIDISYQYTGDTLYDVLVDICTKEDVGFTLEWDEKCPLFYPYKGTNHTIYQTVNPHVMFSQNRQNLNKADYKIDFTKFRNVAYIQGEGDYPNRKSTLVDKNFTYEGFSSTGIERKEIYVDARGTTSKNKDNTTMSDADYIRKLQGEGWKKVGDCNYDSNMTAEVESGPGYEWLVDYGLGDLVSLDAGMGQSQDIYRVDEVTFSEDINSFTINPKFGWAPWL